MFVDAGASVLSGNGVYRSATITGNYQHSLKHEGSLTHYVTLGGGVSTEGVSARTSSHAVFGAGLGIRQMVAEGRGSGRLELRGERISDEMTLAGLKFGFDLWLRSSLDRIHACTPSSSAGWNGGRSAG
jgi:hypothetical protein